MRNRTSQKQRIINQLNRYGEVSRNYFINLSYDKITRLSEYIRELRNEGWDIETIETKQDTVYKVKGSPYKKIVYKISDGRQMVVYEKS